MQPLSQITLDAAEKHSLTIRDLRGLRRNKRCVAARRWAARVMYEEGYGLDEIAQALNRRRSTALNLVRGQPDWKVPWNRVKGCGMTVDDFIEVLKQHDGSSIVRFSVADDESPDPVERWFVEDGMVDHFEQGGELTICLVAKSNYAD